MSNTQTTKYCPTCETMKSRSEFYKYNRTNGLQPACKVCQLARAKARHGEHVLSPEVIKDYIFSLNHFLNVNIVDGPLPTPCHIWQKGTNNHGYGRLTIGGQQAFVHRLALVAKIGRHIDPAMTASHLCHDKLCCNPKHILEESMKANIARNKDEIAMAKRAA